MLLYTNCSFVQLYGTILDISYINIYILCTRYETNDPNLRFTDNQLAEIRKSTMASLVCNNCDVVDKVQLGVFDIAHNFL